MKRPLQLLDVVALLEDHSKADLIVGQVWTIVELLADGVFEVEFSDQEGVSYGEVTVPEDQLIPLKFLPQTEKQHFP